MKSLFYLLLGTIWAVGFVACDTSRQTDNQQSAQEETPAKATQASVIKTVEAAGEQTSAITVTDLSGRKVVLAQPAQKIVDCTHLGGTRMLIQMEAEDLLVGTTDRVVNMLKSEEGLFAKVFQPISIAAPQLVDLPTVGKFHEPDIETILSLAPDVIFVSLYNKAQATSLQKQTGVPTVCVERMNGQFDYDLYEIIGKVIGKEKKAQEMIAYLEETMSIVTDVTNAIPDEERKSLFYWIHPTKNGAPRSNGIYEAFDYAGAINVASNDEGVGMYEVTKEQIVSWNPDFIFLQPCTMFGDSYYSIEDIKKDPIIKHAKAVKSNNVYYLRGPKSDFDTAVEAAEVFYVAKLLYPDKFQGLDVDRYCNEIFENFYGVEGLYSQMRDYTEMKSWE